MTLHRLIALAATLFLVFLGTSTASAAVTERSVYYSYDAMGRQVSAKFDGATGADGVTNQYNGFGELKSTTLTMGTFSKTITSTYDCVGRRTQVTHPDNQSFAYTYDALGRLTGVYQGAATAACPATSAGTPLDSFTYNNDATLASRNEGSGSYASYTWDDIGRLKTQNDFFAVSTTNVGWTFDLNPASQITREARTNNAYAYTGLVSVNRPYQVNGLNQYTSAGPASFNYDDNGNLISDGTNSYTYDVENRLVTATRAGTTVYLTYDPLGRLWQLGGSAIADVQFLYDGDALVAEYSASSGAMTNRYVHGSNVAADDPLVWYAGGSLRYLHTDHLGSVVAATNGPNDATTINTYDEYGIPGSANTGRFQYTGQAWLGEIGMYYYKARIYSPTLGRFLQTDPIGYAGGINIYAYASDDPENATDPSGLQEIQANTCSRVGSSGCSGDYAGSTGGTYNLSTTKTERNALAKGTEAGVNDYWKSRCNRGDPVGCLAPNYKSDGSAKFPASVSRSSLENAIRANHVIGHYYVPGAKGEGYYAPIYDEKAVHAEYVAIRLDLARASMYAVDHDASGVRGLLSAQQIAGYHWQVFRSHNLNDDVYGGSMFGHWSVGLLSHAFCGYGSAGCDAR
jgi:RHS repeat-associated protein